MVGPAAGTEQSQIAALAAALGASGAAGTARGQGSSQASGSETIDQSQFLQLFISQLENQNPLSPLSPDELTAQLAQFSSLEQLLGINNRLDALAAARRQDSLGALVGLLGREVTVQGGYMEIADGKPSDVSYRLRGDAAKVTVQVRRSDGTLVRTLELGEQRGGRHELEFDGHDEEGLVLPDGSYSVEISAVGVDGEPVPVDVYARGTVSAVDLTAQPPALMVLGHRVGIDRVREVRPAG